MRISNLFPCTKKCNKKMVSKKISQWAKNNKITLKEPKKSLLDINSKYKKEKINGLTYCSKCQIYDKDINQHCNNVVCIPKMKLIWGDDYKPYNPSKSLKTLTKNG